MRVISKVAVACAAMALGACGPSSDMPDGGDSKADMAAPIMPPPLTLEGSNGAKAANTACVGKNNDPAAPTVDTVVTGNLKDFQDDNKVVGATIELYASVDDLIAKKPLTIGKDANNMPTTSVTTDTDGNFTYTVPAGHYRVIRVNHDGKAVSSGNMVKTIATYEFNVTYSDKGPTAVKITTKEAIPGLVSVTQMDGLGIVAGGARDCDNVHMAGAVAKIEVPNSTYTGEGLLFYFADVPGAGTVPVRKQKWTGDNGVFAALNVPPDQQYALVSFSGVPKAGDPLTKLAEYKIPIIADSVTIVEAQVGPTTAQ
jgi:hypothetical protein